MIFLFFSGQIQVRSSCQNVSFRGMGAVCCDGVEACTAGSFVMGDGECQSDICCSGNGSCQASDFQDNFPISFVRSQRCDGIGACKGGDSSYLSGDLTCDGMASCEDRTVSFVSEVDVTPTHAITCTGENACRCDPSASACTFSFFDLFAVTWCQDHGNRAISVCSKEIYGYGYGSKLCTPVIWVTLKSLLTRWFLT